MIKIFMLGRNYFLMFYNLKQKRLIWSLFRSFVHFYWTKSIRYTVRFVIKWIFFSFLGNGMTSQTLNMTKKSPSNTVTATGVYSRVQNTTQTDQLEKNTSKAFSNTLIAAIIILSCVSAIIFLVLVFSSRRRTPRFDFTACHLRWFEINSHVNSKCYQNFLILKERFVYCSRLLIRSNLIFTLQKII